MTNRGSTLMLTNKLVGVHPSNINIKFEANQFNSLLEVDNDDDGHRAIASHTHSLSVTIKCNVWQTQGMTPHHVRVYRPVVKRCT